MTEKHFKPRHSSDIHRRRVPFPSCSIQDHQNRVSKTSVESVERLKQNFQKVNPAVRFPKMIPDSDSIKLLHTTVGEVAYGSDTNLIVCGVKTIPSIPIPT